MGTILHSIPIPFSMPLLEPPTFAPSLEPPDLSQRLQEADMDGDQPRKGVIRKAEPLNKEVELSSPTSVLHRVVELPAAQHLHVPLPEEGVCKRRKGMVATSNVSVVVSSVCKEVPRSLCAGASLPLWADTTSPGKSTLKP